MTRSTAFQRPTHNFVDDVSWTHGKHTFQFGTQIAIVREPRLSTGSSFSQASANASWTDTAGFAGRGSPLNPTSGGLPGVDPNFANSYDYPIQALLGIVSEVDAKYNFQKDGSSLPDGTALKRNFGINSYEFYMQDSWKVKPSFTLTLGLRYSLFSPPWETTGLQVIPNVYMSQFFADRGNEGAAGLPSSNDTPITFDFGGKANGKPGYYNWDYHNLGPRVAFAWAPHFSGGFLGDLFGGGKTAIRGGFGIVYDRFGQGIIDDFDSSGSFGLSTTLTNPAAVQTVSSAPRVTDIHTIPTPTITATTFSFRRRFPHSLRHSRMEPSRSPTASTVVSRLRMSTRSTSRWLANSRRLHAGSCICRSPLPQFADAAGCSDTFELPRSRFEHRLLYGRQRVGKIVPQPIAGRAGCYRCDVQKLDAACQCRQVLAGHDSTCGRGRLDAVL